MRRQVDHYIAAASSRPTAHSVRKNRRKRVHQSHLSPALHQPHLSPALHHQPTKNGEGQEAASEEASREEEQVMDKQTAYRLLLIASLMGLAAAARPTSLDQLLFELELERVLDGALEPEGRERRSEPAGGGQPQLIPRPEVRRAGGFGMANQLVALGELNAIESLSSLLEDGNPRLGRAYKPKTMSTARGFGKRASP